MCDHAQAQARPTGRNKQSVGGVGSTLQPVASGSRGASAKVHVSEATRLGLHALPSSVAPSSGLRLAVREQPNSYDVLSSCLPTPDASSPRCSAKLDAVDTHAVVGALQHPLPTRQVDLSPTPFATLSPHPSIALH